MQDDTIESLRGWRRFQYERPFVAAGVWALVAGLIAFGKMDDWRFGAAFAAAGYLVTLFFLLRSRREFKTLDQAEDDLRSKLRKDAARKRRRRA